MGSVIMPARPRGWFQKFMAARVPNCSRWLILSTAPRGLLPTCSRTVSCIRYQHKAQTFITAPKPSFNQIRCLGTATTTTVSKTTWVDHLPTKVRPYFYLTRIDKPIGTLLLFYPCGWSPSQCTSDLCSLRLEC